MSKYIFSDQMQKQLSQIKIKYKYAAFPDFS